MVRHHNLETISNTTTSMPINGIQGVNGVICPGMIPVKWLQQMGTDHEESDENETIVGGSNRPVDVHRMRR